MRIQNLAKAATRKAYSNEDSGGGVLGGTATLGEIAVVIAHVM
jgi:hypothetical protein